MANSKMVTVRKEGKKVGEYNPDSFEHPENGTTFRASRNRGKEFSSQPSVDACIKWIMGDK